MSWSLSVGQSAKADFGAAVDAAQPSPAPPGDGSPFDVAFSAAVANAKAALKALASEIVTDDYLTASAAGHVPNGEAGDWPRNSVNVSLNGVDPPAVPAEVPPTPAQDAEGAEEPAPAPAPVEPVAPVEPPPVVVEAPPADAPPVDAPPVEVPALAPA
jgi:hypothetical protein